MLFAHDIEASPHCLQWGSLQPQRLIFDPVHFSTHIQVCEEAEFVPYSFKLHVLTHLPFLLSVDLILCSNLSWTDFFAGFSNGSSFLSLDCALDTDPGGSSKSIQRMLFNTLFPFVVILFLVSIYSILRMLKGLQEDYSGQWPAVSILVVLYMSYLHLTRQLLQILYCVGVDEGGNPAVSSSTAKYWVEDTEIKCYEGSHALLLALVGAPLLFFISSGLPIGLMASLLALKKSMLMEDPRFVSTFGFLYRGYKEDRLYWEVVVMIRKALLAAIAVFSYPLGGSLQGTLAAAVLVASIILHQLNLPYSEEAPKLNFYELLSLSVSTFTFFAGVVFEDANTSDGARIVISVLLIALNATFVVYCFSELVHESAALIEQKLKDLEIETPDKVSTWKKLVLLVNFKLQGMRCKVAEAARGVLLRLGPQNRRGEKGVWN